MWLLALQRQSGRYNQGQPQAIWFQLGITLGIPDFLRVSGTLLPSRAYFKWKRKGMINDFKWSYHCPYLGLCNCFLIDIECLI